MPATTTRERTRRRCSRRCARTRSARRSSTDVDGTLAPIVQRPAGRGGARGAPASCCARSPGATPWSAASAAGGPWTRGGSSGSMSSPTRATTASSCCSPARASSDPTHRSTATSEDAPRFVDALDSAASWSELGIRTEDKGAIIALHWRGAENEGAAESLAHEIASEAEWQGLVPHQGRKVLEIRPNVADQQGDRRGGADPGCGRSTPRCTAATTAPTWTPSRPSATLQEDGELERGRLHRRWPPMRRRRRSRRAPTSTVAGPEGFVARARGAGRVARWRSATCCG